MKQRSRARREKVASGFRANRALDYKEIWIESIQIIMIYKQESKSLLCIQVGAQPYGPMKISPESVFNFIRAKLHVPLRF